METIELPGGSDRPQQQNNGYWITKWNQSFRTSCEESKKSSASEKMLNYVCEVLKKIVHGLNTNFSKLSNMIIENHREDRERQRNLRSQIEATDRKVTHLQETLDKNVKSILTELKRLNAAAAQALNSRPPPGKKAHLALPAPQK